MLCKQMIYRPADQYVYKRDNLRDCIQPDTRRTWNLTSSAKYKHLTNSKNQFQTKKYLYITIISKNHIKIIINIFNINQKFQ